MDQAIRERDMMREEEWRREQEMERLKDKKRNREKKTDPWDYYTERGHARGAREREGGREWSDRDRRIEGERHTNGRPTANLEARAVREMERGKKKGDTFPRMTRTFREPIQRMDPFKEGDVSKEGRSHVDRHKGSEMIEQERDRAARRERRREEDRYGQRQNEGVRIRSREEADKYRGGAIEDGTEQQRERMREYNPGFRERKRERDSEGNDLWSRREKDGGRERDKPKPRHGERPGGIPSPQRRRDREYYSDREAMDRPERGDGRRDNRSEGDNDGDRQERKRYNEGERQRYRDNYREREGARPRMSEETRKRDGERERRKERELEGDRRRWQVEAKDTEGLRQKPRDRREDDRVQNRGEEGGRRRGGQTNQSASEHVSRPPPQPQSSGEWSSDMESERRWRRPRQRQEAREPGRESTAGREGEVGEETSGERDRSQRQSAARERAYTDIESRSRERDRGAGMWRMWRGYDSKDPSLQDRDLDRERLRGHKQVDATEPMEAEVGTVRGRDKQVDRNLKQRKAGETDSETERQGGEEEDVDQAARGGSRRESDKGVSVDGDEESEVWGGLDQRKPQFSCDGERRDSPRSDSERASFTDKTDESDRGKGGGRGHCTHSDSEGGSETGLEEQRYRMPSAEDGFVTVSSGGDEEREEEEFEDCKEYLDDGVSYHATLPIVSKGHEGEHESPGEWTGGVESGKGELGDEEGRKRQPTYVFCVIGQTLPRSRPNNPFDLDKMESEESILPDSGSGQCCSDDIPPHPEGNAVPGRRDEYNASDTEAQGGEAECERESNEHRVPRDVEEREEPSITDVSPRPVPAPEEMGTDEGLKAEAVHPYAEIGPQRDLETNKLLAEWRAKNREHKQKERQEVHSVNPHGDADSLGITGPDQASSNETSPEAMNLEEPIIAAIQVRGREAKSEVEEVKRHSQAPHLKWAKNVVSEIFGASESQANTELHQGSKGREPEKEQGDSTEGGEENFVHTASQRIRIQVEEPAAELGAQPLQPEDARDDVETRSDSWGDVELRNVLDTIQRKRKNSRFFNKAQLYQQYNEAAQNIEIMRQSRSDFLSSSDDPVSLIVPSPVSSPSPSPPPARRPLPPLPSAPHHHFPFPSGSFSSSVSAKALPLPEPPKTERRASSPRLSASLGQSSSLWQELPGVRNSTELGELAEDQRRLQEVRFEVLTSEASYCRSLDIVVEHFVKSKQLGALLTAQDRNWLFSRLADVRAISHSFLSKLEERIDSDTIHFTVCDIIARYCPHFKMVYVPYLTNQSYQDATYQRLMSENPGFKRVVEKLERSTVCQRLPLRSFLILPFQRITRLKLLVQNILKRTAPGTEDETQAIKALKLLEKLIIESNDSITQMKSIESLVSLSAKVDFECRTLPLVSQSRRLVREGPVTEMMDFSMKESERNVYLHLFNDYLLLSLHKEGGRFIVIDHAPVSELRAENCRVKLLSLQKNLFRLYLSNKALLLRTDSQSDKLRWITAVSRPHAEIDYSAAQDFTQMQCIRAIIAQQPDEISLEKAEVILVHQQTSDGWVEGTRLSDRQRGWAPVSHLEAITSSRVRQRNLTDALKITTAAAAV